MPYDPDPAAPFAAAPPAPGGGTVRGDSALHCSIHGRLHLRLYTLDGQVREVRVRAVRPLLACRLVRGQDPAQAVETIGQFYGSCRQAQTEAARLACAAARDGARRSGVGSGPLPLVETTAAHAGHLLVDWPRLLDKDPALDVVWDLRRALVGLEEALAAGREAAASALASVEEAMVGRLGAALDWLPELLADPLLSRLGHSRVAGLPALDLGALERVLAADRDGSFVLRPCWQGRVFETGPLARMEQHPLVAGICRGRGRGLGARLLARLLELLSLPGELRNWLAGRPSPWSPHAYSPAPGVGMAVLETARGRLVHRVELRKGRVERYQIVDPTEWNFHPQGGLVQSLTGLAGSAERLERWANLAAAALDPCVTCRVEVA